MPAQIPQSPLAYPPPAISPGAAIASKEVTDCMAFFESQTENPKPKDWRAQWIWEMSTAHMTVITLLERVYRFPQWAVDHDDLGNYLGFCEVAFFLIFHHHETEEEQSFPTWEKASGLQVWRHNVEQHHIFHPALDAAWLYVHKCRQNLTPTPQKITVPVPPPRIQAIDLSQNAYFKSSMNAFDPKAFQDQMDTWVLPLVTHLRDEIDTLKPEYMEKIGEKVVEEDHKAVLKTFGEYDPAWFLCCAIAAVPPAELDQMLPVPWFIKLIFVPLWWSGKFWGMWRYMPHPENLTLLGRS